MDTIAFGVVVRKVSWPDAYGCEAWYSVLGGLFPITAKAITEAALSGNAQKADRLSDRLEPLWSLFSEFGGSFRVIATAAELRGFTHRPSVPLPIKNLGGDDLRKIATVIDELELA